MKKEHIIVVIQYLFRFILGGLLIFAGVLKIQDNTTLFESVAYIPWLSIGIKSMIIDTLPYVEIAAGSLLIFKIFDKIILPVNSLIYLSFLIFAIWGLSTGIEMDCGCFGDLDSSSFFGSLLGSEMGWKMVIRNSIFVLMIAFLYFNPFTLSSTD